MLWWTDVQTPLVLSIFLSIDKGVKCLLKMCKNKNTVNKILEKENELTESKY